MPQPVYVQRILEVHLTCIQNSDKYGKRSLLKIVWTNQLLMFTYIWNLYIRVWSLSLHLTIIITLYRRNDILVICTITISVRLK
jgi:hypothetical protein